MHETPRNLADFGVAAESTTGTAGGAGPNAPRPQPIDRSGLGRFRSRRRVFVRRSISRRERWSIGTLSVLVAIGLWQLLASEAVVDPLVASSPAHVVQRGIQLARDGTLGPAVGQTAGLFAIGLGVSLLSGLLIGVLIGWYPRVEAALDPFISVLYAVPRIALVPLIMVWAGLGFRSQVIIVWTTAVFPIIINTAVGVGGIDRHLIAVARSFRASSLDVLRTIALPGAVPAILAGVRQAVALALIGVVVAEYFVGNNGLGGMIVNAGQTVDTAEAYVGVVIFAASALILTSALKALERRWSRWRA